jgi:RimJ/RimL family protein N-acetyltransferase
MERQTARLRLRKPSLDDAATVLAIFGDPATSRFNPAGPMRDIGAARARLDAWLAHWDEYGFGYWAIHETDVPDTVIGFGGLLWRPLRGYTGRLQLGYRFATTAWGRGLATEFAQDAIDFAHRKVSADVLAVVSPGNAASIRVLEKAGMRRLGEINDISGQPPSLVFKAARVAASR